MTLSFTGFEIASMSAWHTWDYYYYRLQLLIYASLYSHGYSSHSVWCVKIGSFLNAFNALVMVMGLACPSLDINTWKRGGCWLNLTHYALPKSWIKWLWCQLYYFHNLHFLLFVSCRTRFFQRTVFLIIMYAVRAKNVIMDWLKHIDFPIGT